MARYSMRPAGLAALLIFLGLLTEPLMAAQLQLRHASAGVSQTTILVGDMIDVEVWVDSEGDEISGAAIFLTFDEDVFEIVDEDKEPAVAGFQPFAQGGFLANGEVFRNVRLEADDPAASPLGEQMDYSVVRASDSGTGRVASFSLRAKAPSATTNIQIDETGWITVDEQQRTSEPRIFAVGDVTGPPHLAGVALAQGRVAAEAICGQPSAYDPAAVPHVVYSNPNIAWCGCLDATDDSSIASVPWGYSGRAVGMDASRGMTMLHWEQGSGLVLGVGICGSEACELIETAVLAIEMGATLEDLAAVVPAHPTRSELLGEAARAALLEQSTS